ncbi:MAG: glycogen/starch synthase, partial [Candidatus Omnitrophica bacterium]|nr:glycogen/starch synthase [Candidatus Omnitrophota bacterium]
VTYETPFAPCGGIAAVLKYLPSAFARLSAGNRVCVLTPYHSRLERTSGLETDEIARFEIDLPDSSLGVRLLLYKEEGVDWFFLAPDQTDIFAGKKHPYAVGPNLLRDSLLFGRMAARALHLIDRHAHWKLFLQDWEAATMALALAKEESPSCACYLVLHNSYDEQASDQSLERAGLNPTFYPGESVLLRAIPKVDSPLITVSRQFAADLVTELWQREIIAPHLQTHFKDNLIGVSNGPFAELAITEKTMTAARAGQFGPLKRWKTARRKKFLESLSKLRSTDERPVWGSPKEFKGGKEAWYVMAGRDDPRQKGYEIAALAIERYLKERQGPEKFLLFPIPGEEGIEGLSFLKDLAESFPENILVFPFLFREGFQAALEGSTYGLMPSLYEPFGMANEFYLHGTVAIGRATGGILEQVISVPGGERDEELNRLIESAAERGWYGEEPEPTGFLYRERSQE